MARPSLLSLLAAVHVLGAGCLPGVSDIGAGRAGVELVVAGLEAADRVEVNAARRTTEHHAGDDGAPLRVFLVLEPGDHAIAVEVDRAEERLCESVEVQIAQGEREVLYLDTRTFDDCGEEDTADAGDADAGSDLEDAGIGDAGDLSPDGGSADDDAGDLEPDGGTSADAGEPGDGGEAEDGGAPSEDAGDEEPSDAGPVGDLFDALREEVHLADCDEVACVETTRIKAEGEIAFRDVDGLEVEGTVSEADLIALEAEVMSEAADRLFAGEDPGCPLVAPPVGDRAFLERTVKAGGEEGGESVESLEVTGCTGLAADIRARIAFLRDIALDG